MRVIQETGYALQLIIKHFKLTSWHGMFVILLSIN